MALKRRRGVYEPTSIYLSPGGSTEDKATFSSAVELLVNALGGGPADADTPLRFIDFGCATGAFQRVLARNFPRSYFVGVDITPEFIAEATAPRTDFIVGDVLDFPAEGRFDAVTMIGTLGLFDDAIKVLERLISVAKPGGVVIVEGFINSAGYDVNLTFRRRHDHAGEPDWEFGFNQFSQESISRYLDSRELKYKFLEFAFPIDLERSSDEAHLRSFTTRLSNGSRLVVNDLNLILPQVFLTIRT